MSNWDELQDKFSDYIDGELAPEERRQFEAALSENPGAHETIQRMRLLKERLARLEPIEASTDFESRLHRKIQATGSRRGIRYPLAQLTQWRIPAIGFAVVLMVVSAMMFFNVGGEPASLQTPQESGINRGFTTEDSRVEEARTPQQLMSAQEASNDSLQKGPSEALKKNVQLVNEKPDGK